MKQPRLGQERFGVVRTLLFLVPAFVLFCSGCGESGARRLAGGGRVTHNGEAVESATISFIPEQGPAANGDVDSGSYAFTEEDGPVPGRQKVILEQMVTDKFKSSGGRWEFEIVVPQQGPFIQHFELNDAKQNNP